MATATVILITGEHAGREIPTDLRRHFRGASEILAGHRGHDIGSLDLAVHMAAALPAPLMLCLTSRLVIELNRSLDHPRLFSEFTRDLPVQQRQALIDTIYLPHRDGIETFIAQADRTGARVVHVGVHTFTDVLDGRRRTVDLGLLFDPDRAWERDVCRRWAARLADDAPTLRLRDNEPYLGTDDGLTTYLRTRFAPDRYAGIEIEVRQGLLGSLNRRRAMARMLAGTLRTVIEEEEQGNPPCRSR